jgi:hypothetical protein
MNYFPHINLDKLTTNVIKKKICPYKSNPRLRYGITNLRDPLSCIGKGKPELWKLATS